MAFLYHTRYWHPLKWVAKLRHYARTQQPVSAPDKRMLLLRIFEDGGHFGEGGRFSQLRDVAFEFAFLWKVLGLPSKTTSNK